MKIAALNQRVEAVENLYSKVVDIHDWRSACVIL